MSSYRTLINFIQTETPYHDETHGKTRYHDYIGTHNNEAVFIHAETENDETTFYLINRDSVLFLILTVSSESALNSYSEFDYSGLVWRLDEYTQKMNFESLRSVYSTNSDLPICVEFNPTKKRMFVYHALELPMTEKPVVAKLFYPDDYDSFHELHLAVNLWLFAKPETVMNFLSDKTPLWINHKPYRTETIYFLDSGELGLLSKAQLYVNVYSVGTIEFLFFGGSTCFYSFGVSVDGKFFIRSFNNVLNEG